MNNQKKLKSVRRGYGKRQDPLLGLVLPGLMDPLDFSRPTMTDGQPCCLTSDRGSPSRSTRKASGGRDEVSGRCLGTLDHFRKIERSGARAGVLTESCRDLGRARVDGALRALWNRMMGTERAKRDARSGSEVGSVVRSCDLSCHLYMCIYTKPPVSCAHFW